MSSRFVLTGSQARRPAQLRDEMLPRAVPWEKALVAASNARSCDPSDTVRLLHCGSCTETDRVRLHNISKPVLRRPGLRAVFSALGASGN
mmetsp:Transcript_8643/g.15800  ORF Transcript_8643/g.15800 Transcript_8643/m.15800 type:complete len:90 (-) Transcript_8643:183-452(-)